AGTNCPYWFIGNDSLRQSISIQSGKRRAGLFNDIVDVGAGFANLQRLTNTDNRRHAVFQRCGGLLSHQFVRFIVVLAALGVADNDVGATQCRQHCARYFTGVRTGLVLRDILGTIGEFKLVAFYKRLCNVAICETHQERNIYVFVVVIWQSKGKLLQLTESSPKEYYENVDVSFLVPFTDIRTAQTQTSTFS